MILLDGVGCFLVCIFPQCVVFLYLTVFSALGGLDLVVLSSFKCSNSCSTVFLTCIILAELRTIYLIRYRYQWKITRKHTVTGNHG